MKENEIEIFHPFPSIRSAEAIKHKPSVLDRVLYSYGYVNVFDQPIARRNRITGTVEVRYPNYTFQRWEWMEVQKRHFNSFVRKKYW